MLNMPESCSPAANYLTRNNIVHERSTAAAAKITAMEAAARVEIAERMGVTSVTGGTIDRSVD